MRTLFLILSTFLISYSALGKSYSLSQGDVIGHIQILITKPNDRLAQIARDYDMGFVEMQEANPGVKDPDHIPAGTALVIPSQYILPNAPHKGLVINLAEMRLYYYPPGKNEVITHPMGIGRGGEDTPIGTMRVIEHITHPTWTATATMRKLRAEEGVILPKSLPPGPDNPMGDYAMRFSRPTYLMHGTNDPLGGIGRRSSSGCMRLYPEDIEALYKEVSNGTLVTVVNEPYKAGWITNGYLYLESHIWLNDEKGQGVKDASQIRQVIESQAKNKNGAQIQWNKARDIAIETQGIPQLIGRV